MDMRVSIDRTEITNCTVGELIKRLQELPPDLPVFVRPKYHGDLKWCDDAIVKTTGVCEMHPKDGPKNVTILV